MQPVSPLWPAQLDHLGLESDDPPALAAFYRDTLGMAPLALSGGLFLLIGPERRLVIAPGPRGGQPVSGFRLQSAAQLDALRTHLTAAGLSLEDPGTPVFAEGAFALRDPDGRLAAFGLPRADLPAPERIGQRPPASALPARLQHVVIATADLARIAAFYEGTLGFVPSDYVRDAGTDTAIFWRSDPEHHSFAAFRAPAARPDHHSYEAGSWNDIRDWADHLAALRHPIWWGPGRHGPGNNLFFMAHDPQGYLFEISAEIEIMPREVLPRVWPHEERSLNLWGRGFMRS